MQIEENISFKDLTTVKLGGEIKYLIRVKSSEELPEAIKFAKDKDLPFLVIGGASNLLVSDEGYKGVVIKMENSGITMEGDNLVVESGTFLQELVDYTIEHNLEGLHKMTGIPGTVGGALYGNAGAYGQMIGDSVVSVSAYNPENGEITTLSKEQCNFGYRQSNFSKDKLIILTSTHQLGKNQTTALKEESEEIIKMREEKYKPGTLCPGSFFKNFYTKDIPQEVLDKLPPRKDTYGKTPAYVFLEELGAKGDQIGDIQIAPFHANLIINLGNGTAYDFYALTKKWFLKVKEKFGIELEPEVQLINLPPLSAQ